MTREEAIHKMEFSINAYQKLIDDSVQEGKFISGDVKGTWKTDSPSIIDAYKDMIEACKLAIKALEHEQALREAFNIAVLYGKEKGMEAIDNALYQMGMDGIKEQEIKALEQEPCDDVINRQAVNTLIDELARAISDERCCISRGRSTATIMRDILHLPPVTPQPKTGHWITTRTFMHDGEYYCDKCKCDSPNNEKWDYCPNCGCRMYEPQESEEV